MNACKNYQKMIKDYDEGRLSLKQEEIILFIVMIVKKNWRYII